MILCIPKYGREKIQMKIANLVKKINNPVTDRLVVFLVCFIPKFVIAVHSIMINTISDETSSISVAAFLAGYDWRDVISNAGYYGIGYLFIFFPLFKIGISAVSIYRIILSVNAILIGFTGVICYSILSKFFKMENRIIKIVISSTCGCMSIFSTSITRARNEDIYLLCGWLFAYVILRLLDETVEKKTKYEFLLLALILYMLTIHSRAVTYLIAFILVCCVYWLFFHKKLVSRFFWLFLIFGYAMVHFLLKQYQQWVWQSSSVRNASLGGSVTSAFSKVTIDFVMIKSVIMIILGQFFTAFSLSGGIFLLAFVVFMLFIYQCIKNRDKLQIGEISLLMVGILYGLMIIITICGQSVTWGVKVYQGIISDMTEYIYAYKAFTYMRYMGSYVPVFIMIALIIAYNNWKIWKRACHLWMPVAFILLFLFWLYVILPYVKDTKSNMEFFISIVSLPSDVGNSVAIWYKVFFILFMMVFFWMLSNSKSIFVVQLLVLGILFTSYERMEIFSNKILISEQSIMERANEGYNIIQQLHDKLLEENVDICVVETQDKTDHQVWYIYQFLNYDLHIIPGSKDEISQTDIIFSNGKIKEYLTGSYTCYKLDKNEYVYSKNSDYSMMIKSMGYEEFTE